MEDKKISFSNLSFSDIDIISPKPEQPLGEGGYGLTWRAQYRPMGASSDDYQDIVVKVLKINTNQRTGCDSNKDFLEEIQYLKKLRHQGIVRVIRQGTCKINQISTPYYITEWEEAQSLDKVLKQETSTYIPIKFVFSFLTSILDVLAYCHRHKIIHLDIKPDNILAKFNGDKNAQNFQCFDHCILIDFGKAKNLQQHDSKETTPGGAVWDYVHPNLRPFLRRNKVDKILFDLGPEGFDLFAVSSILKRDLFPRIAVADRMSSKYQFLDLLVNDLENPSAGSPGYRLFSAEDGLMAIQRYRNNIEPDKKPIRLSAGITVGTSNLVRKIIDTLEFQRLRKVSQLSLTHLVYPSATHTRFSHSIGAYYMAERYAKALLQEPLFCIKYSQHDIDILKIRALLHDIGHYPMAHYLEELPGAITGLKLHHATYGERLRNGEIECRRRRSRGHQALSQILKDAGIQQEIAVKKTGTLFDAIIDGPVDCDKLDYLIRDGLSCGVPYAKSIDVERFLSSLTWHRANQDGPYSLAITPKGIAAAETILIARYQLFAEVYWHKTCRSAVAMIKEAFLMTCDAGKIDQNELDNHLLEEDDRGVLEWLSKKLTKLDRDAASDLINNALLPGGNRALYKRVTTYSKAWEQKITTLFYSEIGRTGIKQLSKLKTSLVEELNRFGKRMNGSAWINLQNHHLLLDRPPENKDSLGELTVKYPSTVLGKKTKNLSELSSVVRSLDEAFAQKVSRVRIFVHPAFCDQIADVTKGNARNFFDTEIQNYFSDGGE